MISNIFEFLKFKDRKVASTVCWSWYNASIQPRFLKKVVICLKGINKMYDVLNIYTKSLLPFFAFRILEIGIEDLGNAECSTNQNCWDWVYTIWPLLAPKVIYLEFIESIELRDDILPALLNVTQQLKGLKIRDVGYCRGKILYEVNRIQSLEELELQYTPALDVDDKTKMLGIIPKTLRKLCVKSVPKECEFVINDLINVIKFCSSHLKSVELFEVGQIYEIMESMVNLNMNLKKFGLHMVDHMDCDRAPEIILLLLKTQWPLVDLKLCAYSFTYDHVFAITNTFKDLEKLSVSGLSERAFETMAGIDGSSFEALSRLTNSISSLTKLKSLYIGIER
ncbi:Uncharacterized protein FWK35_00001548 [Aphis craccivora]|uniref:F-box domain-containing protein n=1 Tax=Aphis craccivora TaxID=307492 RepID=A0A6G0ZCA4_APHCR|nr:Uncharacterized protein FWK35_00001548 [Aphis craccivora]